MTPPTVKFDLQVGFPAGATDSQRQEAAALRLAALPQCATWIWKDGSAEGGIENGGAGAFERPDGEVQKLRTLAGRLCWSYRAEMVALLSALNHLLQHPAHEEDPVVICTDNQAGLAALRSGPSAQVTTMGAAVWRALAELAAGNRHVHLQWVPSHCGLAGNERADSLAKEAAALPQEDTELDVRSVHRAASRMARGRTASHCIGLQ